MTIGTAAGLFAVYMLAGGVAGTVSFLLLRYNVRLYTVSAPRAVALHIGRLAALALALVAIAQAGALPLLAALAGILAARSAVIRFTGAAA